MNRIHIISKQLSAQSTSSSFPYVQKLVVPFHFENEGSLKGKTIVISGGSRGIGLAIVLRAARDGANVAILAKIPEPLFQFRFYIPPSFFHLF